MTKSLRSAQLVLNTANFFTTNTTSPSTPSGLDTRYGTADGNRLNCTFTSLDWETILGTEMFYQYTSFSLCLESFVYLNNGGTPFASGYPVTVNARGLPWVNACYDVATKSRTDSCQIYCGGLGGYIQLPNADGSIFLRPNRYQDFTLTMASAQNGLQSATGDRAPIIQYVFKIYGVDKA